MKIVFVAKYYDSYINHLEDSIADIDSLSYYSLMEKLNNDYFSMYNSYVNYLNKLPNVECKLIVPNWERLQRKWSQENSDNGKYVSQTETAILQIKQFCPDILFINSNFEYYDSILKKVRSYIKIAVTWISCPLPNNLDLTNIDHIFTLFPPHQAYFNSIGKSCSLTTAGFDSEILQQLPKSRKDYDISFVGGIGKFHRKREQYLKYLVPKTRMKLWGYGYTSNNLIKNIAKQLLTRFIYYKQYNGTAWGMKMFKILHDSKITFNCHGDIAEDYSVNMRMFEATGVGTLLITEYSKNIENFFIPGKEIICYKSKEDALEKIKYYLKHENERKAIADAGQKKTLESFSYEQLTLKMYEKFKELLNK